MYAEKLFLMTLKVKVTNPPMKGCHKSEFCLEGGCKLVLAGI